MRDNFERFGVFICLDTMKYGINKLLYPYVAVAMYNDLKEVCIGCKGIMIAEKFEGYEFVLNIMFDQTPERSKDKVYVVAGDSIFNEYVIQKFRLTNAKFMINNFHYFSKILPNR